jgi:hypothetical protein
VTEGHTKNYGRHGGTLYYYRIYKNYGKHEKHGRFRVLIISTEFIWTTELTKNTEGSGKAILLRKFKTTENTKNTKDSGNTK